MKSKILYIAAALACFGGVLTSCDETPSYPPVVTPDLSSAKGDGSYSDPFNVSAAIYQASLNGQTSNDYYYTAGYVISGSIDTSYGNADFVIVENPGDTEPTVTVYRVKDFNNAKFTDTDKVKVGDYIVVYAPLINFKGNTPETNGGYLYQINDVVGSNPMPSGPSKPEDPKGDGSVDNPFNVTAAVNQAKENGDTSDVYYYTAGYVISSSIDTGYGNAEMIITDNADGSGSQITVYRTKYFNNSKFTSADQVKVGDYVVVYAPIINFKGNTPETNGGYLYQVNDQKGNAPDEPATPAESKGDGSADNPFNASAAIAKAVANGETSDVSYYTAGYVVQGSIDTNYGNGTFQITDNADGSGGKITVYRAKDFGNAKFTDANKVKVGDYIVVYAPIINYKGNTPETNGGYLYQINDQKDTTAQ